MLVSCSTLRSLNAAAKAELENPEAERDRVIGSRDTDSAQAVRGAPSAKNVIKIRYQHHLTKPPASPRNHVASYSVITHSLFPARKLQDFGEGFGVDRSR